MPAKHGHLAGRDLTYVSWCAMKARCENPANKGYSRYGGRGIVFCEAWRDFQTFLRDMGKRLPGTSLDRIDNDGNYEPGNCRWATPEQQNNNRSDCRMVAAHGKCLTLSQWAKETGIRFSTLRSRLDLGWPVEDALSAKPATRWTKSGAPAVPSERDRRVSAFGRVLTVMEWARETGITREALTWRLEAGWPPEKAVSAPMRADRRRDRSAA